MIRCRGLFCRTNRLFRYCFRLGGRCGGRLSGIVHTFSIVQIVLVFLRHDEEIGFPFHAPYHDGLGGNSDGEGYYTYCMNLPVVTDEEAMEMDRKNKEEILRQMYNAG